MCNELTLIIDNSDNCRFYTDDKNWLSLMEKWFTEGEVFPAYFVFRRNAIVKGTGVLRKYAKGQELQKVKLKRLSPEEKETYVSIEGDVATVATTDYYMAEKLAQWFTPSKVYDSFAEFSNIPANLVFRHNALKKGTNTLFAFLESNNGVLGT